jgi:hypothetical protein
MNRPRTCALALLAALALVFFSGAAFAHGVTDGDKAFIHESTGVLIGPFIYLGAKHKKGKGVVGDEGELIAAFDGWHGWYWRNVSDAEVTITLETAGDYTEVKRLK